MSFQSVNTIMQLGLQHYKNLSVWDKLMALKNTKLQTVTLPSSNGTVARWAVRASESSSTPFWISRKENLK